MVVKMTSNQISPYKSLNRSLDQIADFITKNADLNA